MTIMIVAILNGKTQDEWYNWITDRVKNKYGYQTPETLPQLYSTSRLMSFKVKREAYEQRQRERREREDRERANGIAVNDTPTTSLFGGFANILGSDGSLILHAAPDDDDDDSDSCDSSNDRRRAVEPKAARKARKVVEVRAAAAAESDEDDDDVGTQ